MNAFQDPSPAPTPIAPSRPKAWIWVVLGLILLCLCCLVAAAATYFLRDQVPAIGNVFYTATPTVTPSPTSTPTPIPTPTATPFVAGDCNPATIPLPMNGSLDGFINAGDTFFETIAMYCLWVPEGGSSLEIGIRDFEVDFDIYISSSYEEIMSPTGLGDYYSRAGGAGTPEEVTIPNPGGRYYIQVVSYYFNTSGSFTIWNRFTP